MPDIKKHLGECRFYNCTTFGGSDTRWHRDHYIWFEKIKTSHCFIYNVLEHGFDHPIIRNHSIFHWTIGDNRVWRFTNHIFSFKTNRQNFIILFGNCHH